MTRAVRLAAWTTMPSNGLYIAIYNTVIAALLTAVGFGGGFAVNLVYSQCIGLSAWLLCDGTRRLLWPDRQAPFAPLALAMLVAMPLAWIGGTWFASLLLGHPWRAQSHMTSMLITAAASFIAVLHFREREKVARLERDAAQEKGRAESIERQVAQARLRLLQAQIEPHFLFNTLANLHAMIPADPPRAQLMLDHLNDFLRATLAASRRERSTLGEEFSLLHDYLEILAIRMGKRLRFRLELPESLAGAALPPMLLQPLVENAVKHGVEPMIEGGEISVTASAAEGRLELGVTDTGCGLGAAAGRGGTGTGLALLRERLAAVYGATASLVVADNASGGVSATLQLPLES